MKTGAIRKIGTGVLFIVLLSGMIGYVIQTTEAFQAVKSQEQDIGVSRCGVGLPPCRQDRSWEGVRCMNGYCKRDNAPALF